MADEAVRTFNTVGGGTIQDEVARNSADAANQAIALITGNDPDTYKSKINEIITKINAIGSDLQTLRNEVEKFINITENSTVYGIIPAINKLNSNTEQYVDALHTLGDFCSYMFWNNSIPTIAPSRGSITIDGLKNNCLNNNKITSCTLPDIANISSDSITQINSLPRT